MNLVICEKNIAAKRIAYILSNGKAKSTRFGRIPIYHFTKNNEDWEVVGLKGHIMALDYPAGYNQWTKTPPHELIHVQPCKNVSERGIAAALKSLIDTNPFLIVATDYDREGELIGVEALDLLKSFNHRITNIKRAKFSAITSQEISKAFSKLADVDYNLSSAGEARQIIDLVWGVVLTRFISLTSGRLGREFLSIGRVQSPTLALLVEREKEIKNFQSKPYWKITATLKKDKSFTVTHIKGQIWDKSVAEKIYATVKDASKGTVTELTKTVEQERPPSPFSTTTFLQAASALGLSASKAMGVAEELYMAGLISYPRTDNTVYPYSLNIKAVLEKLANSPFSKEVEEVRTNPRKYPTRGKKQTTDHPPIHPVSVPVSKKLTFEQQKVYELVCRRFLATLAQDAVAEVSSLTVDITGESFEANGYRLLEAHWRKIYPYFKETRKPLPALEKGEDLDVKKVDCKEERTKPPKRYSQGELIAKMEQLSLGTKSTRHEIISKLYNRKYIYGSTLRPTSTAIAVIDSLSHCDVVKPKMTATLEKDMNLIAEGKKTLEETVTESRQMLTAVMKGLEKDKLSIKTNIKNALKEQNRVGICPKCGKELVIRTSKQRKRFVGCTGFPDCKNTYSLPQKGGIMTTDMTCKTCNTPIVKVKMKGKRIWQLCLNSECPSKKK